MANIEGGSFRCFKDGYETDSVQDWNKHCSTPEGTSTHITEEGYTACISCGVRIEYTDLPFHPLEDDGSKGIALRCDDCSQKLIGNVKITKVPTTTSKGGKK